MKSSFESEEQNSFVMSSDDISLPIIDLSGYLAPKTEEERQSVITQIHNSCRDFGFFQVKGHGVPLESQNALLKSIDGFFKLPKEDKLELSYLKNPSRRGYEESGMSLREGDAMADSKEAYYIGREDPVVELGGFYGPNVWPNLPADDFRNPVWEYYQQTGQLGKTIWEILLQGLGFSTEVMQSFAKKPMVQMKMIRYPSAQATLEGQFGVGAHNDFGGVTVLLQQPGKVGLEVWIEKLGKWLAVPADEDVYVINCGDMIMKWSGGRYKSVRHRVINRADTQRLSCATFWHGDVLATNPLNPEDLSKETVGQMLVKRFQKQMSLPAVAAVTSKLHEVSV